MKKQLKTFFVKLYKKTKEKVMIPVFERPTSGHEFDNKIAWISGGSGGVGFAIAKKLLSCGCKVILSGTDENKLKKIADEICSANLKTLVLNYSNISSFYPKVEEAATLFGKVDIFISSVGIHVDRDELDFLNVTEEEYDSIMGVNLKGTYFMCQKVSQYMIANKIHGHILIVSSQSALEPSWSPYRLSKLGIDGITKGMAQRLLEHGIIVNGIGPGPTATSMQKHYDGKDLYTPLNPIHRFTTPAEVAEFAAMLVSDLGNTIVGNTLYMSGGRGIIEIR